MTSVEPLSVPLSPGANKRRLNHAATDTRWSCAPTSARESSREERGPSSALRHARLPPGFSAGGHGDQPRSCVAPEIQPERR